MNSILEMDNAAIAQRVSTFISTYQAKIAECVQDRQGDPKLKRLVLVFLCCVSGLGV